MGTAIRPNGLLEINSLASVKKLRPNDTSGLSFYERNDL